MEDDDGLSVQILIDDAAKVCRTKRALAARLHMSEQNLQGVQKGRRHLTTGQALDLAILLGRNPAEILALAAIERETDETERARLRAGFFQRGTLGAVAGALALICAAAMVPREAEAGSLSNLTNYTLCALLVAVWLGRRLNLDDSIAARLAVRACQY